MKDRRNSRFAKLVLIATIAAAPTASFAQVEVGPGGATVGAHPDQNGSHGHVSPPAVHEDHGHVQVQHPGDNHGPSVHVDTGQPRHGTDADHRPDHR